VFGPERVRSPIALPTNIKRRLAILLTVVVGLSLLQTVARPDAAHAQIVACGLPKSYFVPSYYLSTQWSPQARGCGVLKASYGKIWGPGDIRPAYLMGYSWCFALAQKPRPPFGAVLSAAAAAYFCGHENRAWYYVRYWY